MIAPTLATWIGYIGSALVVASLAMRSILRLRIIGLAGAVSFVAYGYLIDAWPVVITNVAIVAIHVHFLREIRTAPEYFKILEVRPESLYLKYFLECHGSEIAALWPRFEHGDGTHERRRLTIFILRDLVPAGLFVADVENDTTLRVRADFAIPGYRDFKIGRHLYTRGALYERGFRQVVAEARNERAAEYLARMEFRREGASAGVARYVFELQPGSGSGASAESAAGACPT